MNLLLQRKVNEYCYLYGSIFELEEWICDSLEFGQGCQLKAGVYSLSPITDTQTNSRVIGIYDNDKNVLGMIIKDNCQMYHNIKLRKENSNICVGFKVNEPLLVMFEHSMRLLLSKINTALYHGESITITIQDINIAIK